MNVADARAIPYRAGECAAGGRRLAHRIGAVYREIDPNAVVAVGGSVGRGDADRYSDLEILAFWPRLPTPELRAHAVETLGGELWTMDRDGETMEHFGLGELYVADRAVDGTSMISVGHFPSRDVEDAIERVFRRDGIDPEDHAFLAMVRDAVPMGPSPALASWQARIAVLPETLVRALIREDAGFGPWFLPQALAARGDRLTLHAHMHGIERRLLRLLAALNGALVAFPDGKWARRSDARLGLAPVDLRRRLDGCYGTDLAAGWDAMHRLMMETLDLVERRFGSGLTTEGGEDLAAWARNRWNPLPPYTLMLAASRTLVSEDPA